MLSGAAVLAVVERQEQPLHRVEVLFLAEEEGVLGVIFHRLTWWLLLTRVEPVGRMLLAAAAQ
jgi:hypothetical protein